MPNSTVNPITVEVVRNGLAHIANEMATVLRKTSYNMMIYEVRDYCVGIVDPDGNILSQNFGALPIFLADLGPAIVDGVRTHGRDGFQPGDVLIMNHPYVCGQHLNNVVVYTPFFHEGELVAFLAVRAHWIDIGGTRVGFGFSGTREIYEEGLQFRSLKLYRGAEPNQDIFQIITDNVRFAESCLGDLRAQIAACRIGDRGLAALVSRYGRKAFLQCLETIWRQSELLARDKVARIKPGRYEAEALFDSDGVDLEKAVPLKVRVEVAGSEMTIDFSEISEQVPGSINSGESGAVAAARVAFKSLVAPDSVIDEGCFRPLKIVIPPGKILSAEPPAPVGNWSRTLPTVIDLILRALAPAMPDRVAAGHKGDMGGYAFFGINPKTGRRFLCQTIMGGGWGGRAHEDGENATVSMCQGDVQNAPVELQELYYPVLIERQQLREGSGGAGKFRGGLGIEIAVRVLCDAFTNINIERQRTAPWGIFGGVCGAKAKALVKRTADDPGSWLTKKPNYPLKKNASVVFFTAGGGGYGLPSERAPELIERDWRLGYVRNSPHPPLPKGEVKNKNECPSLKKRGKGRFERGEVTMDAQEEFDRRLSRVRQSMREKGLQTLLVYEGGRHNFLRMNYVAYLTDFISVGPETMLLVPLEDAPVLYLSPVWDIPRAQEESFVREVRAFKEFWSRLAALSGNAGLIGREAMSVGLHDQITNALGRTAVNAKDIIENLARSKTPFELERLRRAAEIADAGVKALHEDARPGLKEYELAAIVEYRMRSLGAEDNFGMVVANHHNQALHPPTDRITQKGDIIIGEITPCIGGLFVQICRTMVLGEPAPVVREKYAILKKAMGLGMEAATTGAPASAVAAAINDTFIEYGYEQYCRPPFMRVRGHGLGCGSFAPGSLEDANQTRLEEGMTYIIHPNQYLPETGYLTLGDTVVMTKTKAESLMKSSWDIFIKE